MRLLAAAAAALAACGGPDEHVAPPLDAGLDGAPFDPFGARYTSPDDFPTDGCVPGSLAGFARADLWPAFVLRTEHDGALHTFVSDFVDDREVPHLLTADALMVRRVHLESGSMQAMRACAVAADGTLTGHQAYCSYWDTLGEVICNVEPVVAPPFRRPPGEGDGLHVTLVGETAGAPRWPGETFDVRVAGDTAYLARGADGLRIVDVRDPAHPVERGHHGGGVYYNDLAALDAGGRRYVIAASFPSQVIDVTAPTAPFLIAEIPFGAHTVFLDGTTAYFATGGGGAVAAYDVADPRAPRHLGGFDGGDRPIAVHDLYVEGGVAYLSAIDDGMVVVDFRNPAAPVELGREDLTGEGFRYWHSPWLTRIGGRPVIVHGDEGSSTVLRLLDGDPASPTFLATLGEWPSRAHVSIHNIVASGARAYAAHYRDGLRVFDLTDPAAPAVIAYYNTWILGTPVVSPWAGAMGVDLDRARRRIYLADSVRGLVILEGDASVFP